MLASGRVEIELRLGGVIETVQMLQKRRLLLIEPLVWSRQTYFGENSALMVFSDTHYDPDEYFHEV